MSNKEKVIPVLDLTRAHIAQYIPDAIEGEIVTIHGFRWDGAKVERCEHGKETPFKLHIIETTH